MTAAYRPSVINSLTSKGRWAAVGLSRPTRLGRPIVAKPVFPRIAFTLLPLVAWTAPRLRDNLAALKWLRGGGYVSRDVETQRRLFGEVPSIRDTVARHCRDKDLR